MLSSLLQAQKWKQTKRNRNNDRVQWNTHQFTHKYTRYDTLHVRTQRSFYKSKGIYNRVNKTSLFVLCTHLIDQKKHLTRSNSTIYNKNHGYYYSHRYSCSKITHHACDLFRINHRKKRGKKNSSNRERALLRNFHCKKEKKKKINRGEERKKEREGKRNLNSRISANRFSSNFSRKFRPRFRTSTTHLEVIKRN